MVIRVQKFLDSEAFSFSKRNGASRFIGAPFLFEYSASMDIDAQGIVGY